MKKNIGIIIGVTRENNKGKFIADWVLNKLEEYPTKNKYEILDLKDFNLSHYNEPGSPRSTNRNYAFKETKKWGKAVDKMDAFIFITPEYNGYFTGALKDAVDYLYYEWLDKPYTIIGYGSRGASRATKQLHNLLSSFMMMPSNNEVKVNQPWNAIKDNNLNESFVEGDIFELFKKLESML